ncbi:hypothetical protein FM119_09285 [Mycetocola reblochoni REB411]|uniref:Uncharacterized protein n=1 Tax=Mycetocola reblochoni REB411 TaxID=1255698 RepID=A0A1R4JTT8_9MICO|nr:hypothetical protein FM119_09285 [Mycetocola reblochoni REB411]
MRGSSCGELQCRLPRPSPPVGNDGIAWAVGERSRPARVGSAADPGGVSLGVPILIWT